MSFADEANKLEQRIDASLQRLETWINAIIERFEEWNSRLTERLDQQGQRIEEILLTLHRHDERLQALEGSTPPPPPPPPPPTTGLEVPDPLSPIPQFPQHLFPELKRTLPAIGYAPRSDYGPIDSDELIRVASMVCFGPISTEHESYQQVRRVNPDCKILRYAIATEHHKGELHNWLRYADAHGIDREAGFLNATQRGMRQSSGYTQHPPDKFRSVNMSGRWLTDDAYDGDQPFQGPMARKSLWIGHNDKFERVHIDVEEGGESGEWRYVGVNGLVFTIPDGAIVVDGTQGGSRSGVLIIDPSRMPDWTPVDHPFNPTKYERYLYYLVLAGAGDGRPVYRSIKYYNYLENGSPPVFDDEADADGDGYLSPSERENADTDKTARFKWQSRLASGANYLTDIGNIFLRRYLAERDLAWCDENWDGIFYDVALPAPRHDESVENRQLYQTQQGSFYRYMAEQLPVGKFVMINVSGWKHTWNPWLTQWLPILNLDRTWHPGMSASDFARICEGHRERYRQQDGGRLITALDWKGGDSHCLSETVKYAGLCAYLIHSLAPGSDQYVSGGFNADWSVPNARGLWKERHWCPAGAFDVGEPVEDYRQDDSGSASLFSRPYERAWVYYLAEDAAEVVVRIGSKVYYDGTLSPHQNNVIRPGEGLILAR